MFWRDVGVGIKKGGYKDLVRRGWSLFVGWSGSAALLGHCGKMAETE